MPWGLLIWVAICIAVISVWPMWGLFLSACSVVVWWMNALRGWRLKRIAKSRSPVSFEQFLESLGGVDVDRHIAQYVWSTLQNSLRTKGDLDFPLDPDDELESGLKIHPDDIHMDLMANAFKEFELTDDGATSKANPYYDGAITARTLINFLSVQPKA